MQNVQDVGRPMTLNNFLAWEEPWCPDLHLSAIRLTSLNNFGWNLHGKIFPRGGFALIAEALGKLGPKHGDICPQQSQQGLVRPCTLVRLVCPLKLLQSFSSPPQDSEDWTENVNGETDKPKGLQGLHNTNSGIQEVGVWENKDHPKDWVPAPAKTTDKRWAGYRMESAGHRDLQLVQLPVTAGPVPPDCCVFRFLSTNTLNACPTPPPAEISTYKYTPSSLTVSHSKASLLWMGERIWKRNCNESKMKRFQQKVML